MCAHAGIQTVCKAEVIAGAISELEERSGERALLRLKQALRYNPT